MRDVKGITRVVLGFSKLPNENGNFLLKVEYELKPIDISLLREWFNVDENDERAEVADLIGEIEINTKQAEKLEPYLLSGKFDFEKYDFCLDTYPSAGYEEYWKIPHAREYEEKS